MHPESLIIVREYLKNYNMDMSREDILIDNFTNRKTICNLNQTANFKGNQ